MVLEFDCLTNDLLRFQPHHGFWYSDSNFLMYSASLENPNTIVDIVCYEEGTSLLFDGKYKMLTENTIKLKYTGGTILPLGFTPFEEEYALVGDKLIRTSTEMFPTIYNETSQTWTKTNITITREYSRNFDF